MFSGHWGMSQGHVTEESLRSLLVEPGVQEEGAGGLHGQTDPSGKAGLPDPRWETRPSLAHLHVTSPRLVTYWSREGLKPGTQL